MTSRDDVAVALSDLPAGAEALIGAPALRAPIPRGHKFALRPIAAGERVLKYGHPIGVATQAIAPGEHVHSHNLRTGLSVEESYAFDAPVAANGGAAAARGGEFLGYARRDGRVGTRNEIWIIATVGCVARVCEDAARAANESGLGVDGVYAITHPHGCSQLGDDLSATRTLLAALAQHPNAGGVVLVGLGCESNQANALLAAAPDLDPTRLRVVRAQDVEDEREEIVSAVADLARRCSDDVRTPQPASRLVLGVKCGGSDGFSGLTANPLVGRMVDRVTDCGGAALLSEIPEIFGAERLLMQRAASREVFDDLVALVDGFKRYFVDHGQPIYENPSPGNIAGGITTLEEKSLGAVQKGGQATVTDVRRYGERLRRPGLTVLEAPGNDAVSSTALAAAGATVLLFTTGRGTPLGFPAPTLKIASNSDLAARKRRWIDFDAGVLLTEDADAAEDALFDLVLRTASGEATANERNGERAIAIWKRGVTL